MPTELKKKWMMWSDFSTLIQDGNKKVREAISGVQKPHIVTLYRGGLILGTCMSHTHDAPLSILNYQSYDNTSEEVKFMHNAGINSSELIVLVDDIVDTGNSIKKSIEFLNKEYPNNKIFVYTLVGNNEHPEDWNYSYEQNGNYIVFPWEK